MKERLKWIGNILWMKDSVLAKMAIFGHFSGTKKISSSPNGVGKVMKKDLRKLELRGRG
jgi:hypothetical protein